jgi:hypothetical protein
MRSRGLIDCYRAGEWHVVAEDVDPRDCGPDDAIVLASGPDGWSLALSLNDAAALGIPARGLVDYACGRVMLERGRVEQLPEAVVRRCLHSLD